MTHGMRWMSLRKLGLASILLALSACEGGQSQDGARRLDASRPAAAAAAPAAARSRFVGTNLASIAHYGTQFPFADLMKSSGGWTSVEAGGARGGAFPAMTPDGYPASLKPGQRAEAPVAWDHTRYAPGRYVVLWEGDGAIAFPHSAVAVAETSSHRIALDVTSVAGPLWVSIERTNPADPVRNLRFLWPGTEATHASNPFNPVFLERTAPFASLRFMDWGGTNGSAVVHWADRARIADLTYAQRGVPVEIMIDLANRLRVDPWFCIPHKATDEYVRQFAGLVLSRLDPALKPHIEYSNEVWNTGFPQTAWAAAESKRLGLPVPPSGQPAAFYAQRSVEIFRIMQQVYGADSGRLVRVLSGQAVWTQFMKDALLWKDTGRNADVLAIAPYFDAGPADDKANVRRTLALSSDQIVDLMLASVRGPVKRGIQDNANLASTYKLRLKAYEAGPHNSTSYFDPPDVDAMTALFSAAHRNPRMRDVYMEYLGLWKASGGETMNQYNDIGVWSRWGLWGALESVTQDASTAPKYRGLLDFIAANP